MWRKYNCVLLAWSRKDTHHLLISTGKNEGSAHEGKENLDFGEHYESWAHRKLLGLCESNQTLKVK